MLGAGGNKLWKVWLAETTGWYCIKFERQRVWSKRKKVFKYSQICNYILCHRLVFKVWMGLSTLIPSFPICGTPTRTLVRCWRTMGIGQYDWSDRLNSASERNTADPGLLPGFRSSLKRNFSSDNLWIPACETTSAALPWARQSRRRPNVLVHIIHSYWMRPDCNCQKNSIPHTFDRRNNTSIVTPSRLCRPITASWKGSWHT